MSATRYTRLIEQAERLNYRLYSAMLATQAASNYERAARCRRVWYAAANRTARRMMKRDAANKAVRA